ncbi:hypothetical protein PR202_gb13299 [Eleusine coracana subsp. coracana]|uniref:Chalcone synthase n=1 Tax=Eleusine coracana subsp. coracana TaxID=191504 RepID=A0AAV5ETE7_ELECO|nr:hypothetical protein QOZ80_9BG0712990 [Eleusine coracana subsp. coracana]GJN25470.1 hypothetical protein PR202_gb13299 [Eleusine coracana subsp. coracana]
MSTCRPVTVDEGAWSSHRANGSAAILAIGTSNPVNCVRQNEYADWYFRVTRSDHLGKWKDKMKRICEKSGIAKRYLHHTEEMIQDHPELLDRTLPSLRTRLGITMDAVPVLAAAAATKAIAEWGRPVSDITHLIVNSNSVAASPGADLRLATLLGLHPSVQRTMLSFHGCSGGCLALRLAKDLAENNIGARVLVVCVEVLVLCFRAPDETRLEDLVAMTIFGDGAGAAIVGAGPVIRGVERPIFHMVSTSQATLPGTENVVELNLSESGADTEMSSVLPKLVQENIKQCLVNTLTPVGLASDDLNGLFWAAHPGGRAILDSYETALGLEPGKLAASRRVLSEFGNMFGATVFFVLDEMRRRRHRSCDEEEREKCEWGVMVGLGPGISVEVMVLHAAGTGVED